MMHIREILVPIDYSEASKAAFHLAAALAHDHHAKLTVLHVREAPVAPFTPFGASTPDAHEQPVLEDEFVDFELAHESIPTESLVVSGMPAEEILRAAAERRCELIVMAAHGRTGLARLLTGSVAEQVMRMAPCAVLTLKRPFPAAEALPHGSEPQMVFAQP